MGKQRNMSAEERTRLFAQNNVIVIPSTEARLIRDICNCAEHMQEVAHAAMSGLPGASALDVRARNNALVDALDRVDFQYWLSVPGEYPGDQAE
jgi:hypothetical protein